MFDKISDKATRQRGTIEYTTPVVGAGAGAGADIHNTAHICAHTHSRSAGWWDEPESECLYENTRQSQEANKQGMFPTPSFWWWVRVPHLSGRGGRRGRKERKWKFGTRHLSVEEWERERMCVFVCVCVSGGCGVWVERFIRTKFKHISHHSRQEWFLKLKYSTNIQQHLHNWTLHCSSKWTIRKRKQFNNQKKQIYEISN